MPNIHYQAKITGNCLRLKMSRTFGLEILRPTTACWLVCWIIGISRFRKCVETSRTISTYNRKSEQEVFIFREVRVESNCKLTTIRGFYRFKEADDYTSLSKVSSFYNRYWKSLTKEIYMTKCTMATKSSYDIGPQRGDESMQLTQNITYNCLTTFIC